MSRSEFPASPLRILIAEDRPLDAEIMIAELERAEVKFTSCVRVETADEFIAQLETLPDVILCDYTMPNFSALEALRLIQERGLDVPFIVVSGSSGEETAVDAMKHGADDYLLKDRLGRLGSAILQAVEEKKLRATAKRAQEDLRQSEFKYRCLFEHLPDAAYLCDSATGKIIDTNNHGERIVGLERNEILGKRLGQFIPEAVFNTLLSEANNSADSSLPREVQTSFIRADGHRVGVRISSTAVPIYHRRLLLAFCRELDGDSPGEAESETTG